VWVEVREFLRDGHDVSSRGPAQLPADVAVHAGPGDDSISDANVIYGGGGDDFLDASDEYGRLFGGSAVSRRSLACSKQERAPTQSARAHLVGSCQRLPTPPQEVVRGICGHSHMIPRG
jgi:hypothetical protein